MHKAVLSRIQAFSNQKRGFPIDGQQWKHSSIEGVVYYGLPSIRSTCTVNVENMHSFGGKLHSKMCIVGRCAWQRTSNVLRHSDVSCGMRGMHVLHTFLLTWSVDRIIPQWKSMLFWILWNRVRTEQYSRLSTRKRESFHVYRHKECWRQSVFWQHFVSTACGRRA